MNSCIHHPELEAIEQCEVCQEPLCSLCLWYGEKGHRYCETHAQAAKLQGEQIFSPQTYAEGIPASLSLREAGRAPTAGGEKIYQGNQQDLYGFVAAAVTIVSLLSCFGGIYCLPFIGAILGGVAYAQADKSLDPKRTRLLGGIAMAAGGLIAVVLILFMMMYGALIIAAINGSLGP